MSQYAFEDLLRSDKLTSIVNTKDFGKCVDVNKVILDFETENPYTTQNLRDFYLASKHYCQNVNLDVRTVVGQDYHRHIGKTWLSAITSDNFKMRCINELINSPNFYFDSTLKNEMSFVSGDGGGTYYSWSDGNHRTITAKVVFALEEIMTGSSDYTLHGVNTTTYHLDIELINLMKKFEIINKSDSGTRISHIELNSPNIKTTNINNNIISDYNQIYSILDYRYNPRHPKHIVVDKYLLKAYLRKFIERAGKLTVLQIINNFFVSGDQITVRDLGEKSFKRYIY